MGCIQKRRQPSCWLAALSGSDYKGSVIAWRHLVKRISDRLLRERNCLMIYNKIERVFVTTKLILNYYNNDFSLEITSKVQKVSQKYTFTHKLTTDTTFRRHLYFLAQRHQSKCNHCIHALLGCSHSPSCAFKSEC